VYLKGTELGSNVNQVEALTKKHDAFENVLSSQDAKLDALRDFGERLINEKHFDSKNIKSVADNVTRRRENIKVLSNERKNKLADSLLYAQFNRDAAEAEGWIDDKLKVARQENFKNVKDMQEKMKSLKKHQAFEAEIMANADRIKAIKTTGEVLLKKRHEASPEIQARVNNLIQRWNELLQASNERGKGLEEARDILKFNEEVEKVEDWCREKESLVAACDLGRDYEHCLALQKKVNDVEGGVTVDEERINSIKKLADKLITQGRTETKVIKDRKDSILAKWQNIQGALDAHKNRLDIALEIHAFNRDLDDINDRINEKAAYMSSEDYGKDLAGIQALQRKQEDVD
jgi:spectrin beta